MTSVHGGKKMEDQKHLTSARIIFGLFELSSPVTKKSKREQQKYHSGGFQSLHKLAIAVVHNHHTPWILSLQNQQHTRATNRIKHLTHFLKLGLLVMWDGVHGRRRIEVTCLDLLNCSLNLCNSQGLAP
jgi:hypothetical protein